MISTEYQSVKCKAGDVICKTLILLIHQYLDSKISHYLESLMVMVELKVPNMLLNTSCNAL